VWDGLRFILRSRGIGFVLQRVCLGSAGGQAQRDDQKYERENSAATSLGLAFQIGSPNCYPRLTQTCQFDGEMRSTCSPLAPASSFVGRQP
jgi:hypothetical protein